LRTGKRSALWINGTWSMLPFSLFLLLSWGCSQASVTSASVTSVVVHTEDEEVYFSVDIADTDPERSQGLMNRSSLAAGSGMLFMFEKEGMPAFWMKNALIPLDILFIGADYRVIDLKKAFPCMADPCPLITTDRPFQYVLEVNQGEGDGIQTGDAVEFR